MALLSELCPGQIPMLVRIGMAPSIALCGRLGCLVGAGAFLAACHLQGLSRSAHGAMFAGAILLLVASVAAATWANSHEIDLAGRCCRSVRGLLGLLRRRTTPLAA